MNEMCTGVSMMCMYLYGGMESVLFKMKMKTVQENILLYHLFVSIFSHLDLVQKKTTNSY